MPLPITVPRLGWSMDEGTFVGWLKKEGESVKAGEPLFTLEGDKAAQEVEAVDNGILRIPPGAPKAGAAVSVGDVLGYLVGEHETFVSAEGLPKAEVLPAAGNEPANEMRPVSAPAPSQGPRPLPLNLPCGTVGTRSTASLTAPEKMGTRWNASLPGSRAHGALNVQGILTPALCSGGGEGVPLAGVLAAGDQVALGASVARIAVSPRARRRAAELGVDCHRLKGSGRRGRIIEADVLEAAREVPASGLVNSSSAPP